MITLIAAIDEKHGIGKDGKLPWNLPRDLEHFKFHTNGHTVVMGRTTFDSIGKPLPNRRNIVFTTKDTRIDGVEVVHCLWDFSQIISGYGEIFVIGGEKIYNLFMPMATRLMITSIDGDFGADTFFPRVDYKDWRLNNVLLGTRNEKNPYNYIFKEYSRSLTGR